MERLTDAVKRRITRDWAACFPRLGVHKPMSLLKRNGPLLMGVYLNRGSEPDVYSPSFHVHCLLTPQTDISLALCQPLAMEKRPHLRQPMRLKEHEAEHQQAAARLRAESPLLDKDGVSVREAVGAYADFLLSARDPAIGHYPSGLFLDVILLSYASGFEDYAKGLLAFARESMKAWPARVVDGARWADHAQSMMDRGRLEANVAAEIEKHRLQEIPAYDLTAGEPPLPFWNEWATLERSGAFGPPMGGA